MKEADKIRPAYHYLRMAICFASGGFVFPHAFVENMDPPTVYEVQESKVKK